jgi:hypothetical protein
MYNEENPLIDSLTCRICYDIKNSELISPCKCSGSIKWIHKICLEETLAKNPDKCPTCNTYYQFRVASNNRFLQLLTYIQRFNLPISLFYIGMESVFSCLLFIMDKNKVLLNSLINFNNDIQNLSWFYQYFIWSSIIFNSLYYILIVLSEISSINYRREKKSKLLYVISLLIETLSSSIFMGFLVLITFKFEYTINIILWIINILNYWMDTLFITSIVKNIDYEKKEILEYNPDNELVLVV